MKQAIKRRVIGMAQPVVVPLLCLCITLMLSNCHTRILKQEPAELKSEDTRGFANYPHEVVLFCGSPCVGKSALLNSIFQQPVFESGISIGLGRTTREKQEHIYENRKYIDTPGLFDIHSREVVVQEIERALKANNKSKIVFVVTLESGRVSSEDVRTVNTVCDAIQAPCEYGIIFNKVHKNVLNRSVLNKFNQNQEALAATYLPLLKKQPTSCLIIEKDEDMEEADNVYLPADSKSRKELLGFIANLKPNRFIPNEVVLFCGNPGVGKSALCNSVFQEDIFPSGVSMGVGLTRAKQERIYDGKLYIDTPGLSDISLRQQAAEEIEKALKENNNYKIIFVVTLEEGRMRPDDLTMINTVCEAIQAPFEYGIIFNKVHKNLLNKLSQSQEALEAAYLPTLYKQPASYLIIEKDNNMVDTKNVYLPAESENRKKLLGFIANLKPNRIPADQVNKVNGANYEERIKEMEALVTAQLAAMQRQLRQTEARTREAENRAQAALDRLAYQRNKNSRTTCFMQ